MAQKIVTFEVAKALKEAGYPQATEYWYSKDGKLCYSLSDLDEVGYISAPTYIDAWLWLWDIKNIRIQVLDKFYFAKAKVRGKEFIETNPEEAIAKAIDYLVENKLLK